ASKTRNSLTRELNRGFETPSCSPPSSPPDRGVNREVAMTENARLSRFRFRLGTILFVVAILALLLVVVIQQVQIGRMRQLIDAGEKENGRSTGSGADSEEVNGVREVRSRFFYLA